jgi:dihydrofolate synthase / folylpolyglutamate synthase
VSAHLAWLDSLQGSGIRPGLERIKALLPALGHPERAYQSIIVSGTNGKGSTSAALASILVASGYKTGLYTSPHLVDIHERWMIDREMIDDALLERCTVLLRAASEKTGVTPTYFEALTIVAFIAFREAQCEVVVLEVGMGGRLDATNVVRPLAALITPIGLDHTEFLGTTLRRIAAEKAGVIHRGTMALTTNRDRAIVEVLRRRAKKVGNRLIIVDEDHATPLAGGFQRRNAGLAVRAARELRPLLKRITSKSIERGVAETQWRGRLERLEYCGKTIWIDGLHNAHAAAEVAPFIEKNVASPRLLVFGMMRDKAIDVVAKMLFPLFERVITTEPYPPRSAKATDLTAIARSMNVQASAEAEPARAFDLAMRSRERNIFIGGSLYLAGAAIEYFDAKRQRGRQKQK